MSWDIKCIDLGKCRINRYAIAETRKLELQKNKNGWSAVDGNNLRWEEIEFDVEELNYLDSVDTIEIAKFFRATYHTDLFHPETYFFAVPADDFVFQLKGQPEVSLKKGHAYLFNQRRLHRAHNNGKSFVCAVGAIYRHELPKIKSILGSKFKNISNI